MLGGIFLIILSASGMFAMLVPALLIALVNENRAIALDFLLIGALGSGLAFMLLSALAGYRRQIDRSGNFLALVILWVIAPLIAALTFMIVLDLPFVAAWYEAVSALTTSGGSLLPRDTTPSSILFWRASLEWYGGFLTLVSIIHVLAPGGFGGLWSFARRGDSGAWRGHEITDSGVYTTILLQYAAMTTVVVAGLIWFGVNPLQAAMLGMVTIATGGFLPFSGALEDHVNSGATLVITLGFIFGTLSVFWRRNVMRDPARLLQNNREAAIILVIVGVLATLFAARIVEVSGGLDQTELWPAVVEGLFASASLVATSGLETRPGIFALLPDLLILMVVFIGASVYSTTGGIKVFRIAAMAIHAIGELNRLIYPTSIARLRFGQLPISADSIRAVWAYFALALIIVGAGAFLFTLTATGFEAGLTLAITYFANASPVYDALTPIAAGIEETGASTWPLAIEFPAMAWLVAIAMMTIGRLEVLVIFAVLNLKYWLNR